MIKYIVAFVKQMSKVKNDMIYRYGNYNQKIDVSIYPYTRDIIVEIKHAMDLFKTTITFIQTEMTEDDMFSLIEAIFFDFEVIRHEVNNNC